MWRPHLDKRQRRLMVAGPLRLGPGEPAHTVWVDDVDAACTDLEKSGGTLLSGPGEQRMGDASRHLADPAGHNWEVAQPLFR